MIFTRLLAILIIGGGYLICKQIFTKWPLRRNLLEDKENRYFIISMWFIAFAIIFGQLTYIWIIFPKLFRIIDQTKIPYFLFGFLIIDFYTILLLRKKKRNKC